MNEEDKDEDLLFRALDGKLGEEEERALADRLRVDPALAVRFLRLSRDEALLAEEVSQARAREKTELAARRRDRWWRVRPAGSRALPVAFAISAAAALLLVAALALLRSPRTEPAPPGSIPPLVRESPRPTDLGAPRPVPHAPPPSVEPPREVLERPPKVEVPSPPPPSPKPPEEAVAPAPPAVPERPTVSEEALAVLLIRMTGPVQVRPAGADRPLPGKAGMAVRPGDALDTRGARAALRFRGGSVVYCSTATSIQVQDRGILLQQGEVCCGVERGGIFQVATAEGVARVTGTRFSIQRTSALSMTVITVAEGDVEVHPQAATESIRVGEGYRFNVGRGARTGIPERADPAALAMAWANELRPVLLVENFEGYGSRTEPRSWRDTGPDNSSIEDDSLFKILAHRGSNVFGPVSPAVNIHSHYVGRGAASWTAYRYSGRMMKGAPAAQVGVTFFSQLPEGQNRYYRIRHFAGTDAERPFHVAPHPHHRPPPPLKGETSSGVVPEVGVWYEFQIDVEARPAETAIRARFWKAGTERPRRWAIDCADDRPERLKGGTVGVWAMGGGSLFDDLRVEGIDW